MTAWHVFKGPRKGLPEPPPWRRFTGEVLEAKDPARRRLPRPDPQDERRGKLYQADKIEIEIVNAALVLRRPMLVTGKPGTGKSSLAYAVAHDLGLGPVLRWSITSRSTLKDGLYSYDVLGRLQEQQLHPNQPPHISDFLRLGPLGTALAPSHKPRVLLIDEIDKGDVDLPNDLLHVFEDGRYDIPELTRLSAMSKPAGNQAADDRKTKAQRKRVRTHASSLSPEEDRVPAKLEPIEIQAADDGHWIPIVGGKVQCREFPFVVLTSNGERDFPPAFLRRCVRVTIPEPEPKRLAAIVEAQLAEAQPAGRKRDHEEAQRKKDWQTLLDNFEARRRTHDLATDQLMSALYLRLVGAPLGAQNVEECKRLEDALLKPLSGAEAT